MNILDLKNRINKYIDDVLSERVDSDGNIFEDGMPYLTYFCKENPNYEIVRLLLEKGAIPDNNLYNENVVKDNNVLILLKNNRIDRIKDFISKYYSINLKLSRKIVGEILHS